MNIHPALLLLLTVRNENIICPFCYNTMTKSKPEYKDYWKCESCTHDLIIHPTTITYDFLINDTLKVIVKADFEHSRTGIISWSGSTLDLEVPHLNFPFFNIPAMRHKIKILLPFI
jgi:hypothetical protein